MASAKWNKVSTSSSSHGLPSSGGSAVASTRKARCTGRKPCWRKMLSAKPCCSQVVHCSLLGCLDVGTYSWMPGTKTFSTKSKSQNLITFKQPKRKPILVWNITERRRRRKKTSSNQETFCSNGSHPLVPFLSHRVGLQLGLTIVDSRHPSEHQGANDGCHPR